MRFDFDNFDSELQTISSVPGTGSGGAAGGGNFDLGGRFDFS